MKSLFHAIIIWFLLFGDSYAQSTFKYKNHISQTTRNIIPALGGGYFLSAGSTGTTIVHLDNDYNFIWEKSLGSGTIYSFSQCSNGDLLFTGKIGYNTFVIRTDSVVNYIWGKQFAHGPFWNEGRKIIEHSLGDIYVVGNSKEIYLNDTSIVLMLMKLDSSGNISWVQTRAPLHLSYGIDIAESTDGYIIVGSTRFTLNTVEGNMMYFNPSGTGISTAWITAYSPTVAGELDAICPLPNGGSIALARIPGVQNTAAIKLHSQGPLGTSGIEMEYDLPSPQMGTWQINNGTITQTNDKGFSITGNINDPNFTRLILKVDSMLIPEWCRLYKSISPSTSSTIIQVADRGYLVVSNDGTNTVLIKTDSLGHANCNDSTVTINNYFQGNGGAVLQNFTLGLYPQFSVYNYLVATNALWNSTWDTICYDINNQINEAYLSQIILYPNPASDQFVIDNFPFSSKKIIAFNFLGEVIYYSQEDNLHSSINCGQWPEGIYFVLVSDIYGKWNCGRISVVR